MEKVVYNPIMDKNYIGIVTVLDYETSVRKCLSSVLVGTQNRIERKVIVDLALKVGVNEYRFVVYDITDDGKILWNSSKYVTPCEDIVKLANSYIKKKSFITSVIEASGNHSVTGNLDTFYPVISLEYVINQKPDIVLVDCNCSDDLYIKKIFPDAKIVKMTKEQADIINRPSVRVHKSVEFFAQLGNK